MNKYMAVFFFFSVIAVASPATGNEKGPLEKGKYHVSNGVVRIEVPAAPDQNQILFSIFNSETKNWELLLRGNLGLGMSNYYEVLRNEPAEDVTTAISGGEATLTFRLIDRTKDSKGRGGEGIVWQGYRVTVKDKENSAFIELKGEFEGGKGETAWVYTILPKPARYLVGEKVYGGKSVVDCRTEFEEKSRTIQISSGNKKVGAYNADSGFLYLIHQPKKYYMLSVVSSTGVNAIATVADSYMLYGKNAGAGQDPNSVIESPVTDTPIDTPKSKEEKPAKTPVQLLQFSADGSLKLQTAKGGKSEVKVIRSRVEDLKFVPFKGTAKGIYLTGNTQIVLPIENLDPSEGTLSFWFRPDWSWSDYTPHMIVEIDAGKAYRMSWRKGYSHAPHHSYLTADSAGSTSFGHHNLFEGGSWKHYAIRWSNRKTLVQVTIDGDFAGSGRSGRFKSEETEKIPAGVILSGNAEGVFADVRVFDQWLEDEALLDISGIETPAAYTQRQMPPPGAGDSSTGKTAAYIDPATGEKSSMLLADSEVYDPACMPHLPETVHTKWARPLAGGRLKVLMVMPTGFYDSYSMIREGVELWQRLDMDCKITSMPDPEVMAGEYDVIVVTMQGWSGGFWKGWQDIDRKLRSWVMERVNSGKSGMVIVYPYRLDNTISSLLKTERRVSSNPILRGFPAESLHRVNGDEKSGFRYERIYELDDTYFESSENLASGIVEVYDTGRSRIVKLNYINFGNYPNMGLTPDTALNSAATDSQYDYWMGLAARCVLYASGRKQSSVISGVKISGGRCRVDIEGIQPSSTLWYRARDIWGREYFAGENVVAESGSFTVPSELSEVPPRAVIDLVLKDRKGDVLDWYSYPVLHPKETRITGISLDKKHYEKGDTIRGKVSIASAERGSYRMEVYLADHENRRIRKQVKSLKIKGKKDAKIDFEIEIPLSSDSLLMHVDAILSAEGRIVDTYSVDCPVPKKKFDGFFAFIYGANRNRFTDRWSRRTFRDKYGMDGGLRSGRYLYGLFARDNLHHIEYIAHLGYPGGADKNYCITAREHREEFFPKNLWAPIEEVIHYRPVYYSLGEEHYILKGSCQSPTCTAGFQKHMQKKYGTIEKLNGVWKTGYKSWDEVGMLTPEIVDMMKIKFDVPRFENRRFMEYAFADRHAYLADYIRKRDPYAEVGIHAGWDIWMGRGYDYWLLSRGMESMTGYDLSQGGEQNQYIGSFFRNYYGANYHYWIGSRENVRWSPWYFLMSGARGFVWYCLSVQAWGAVTADLHIGSDFAASASEFSDAAKAGDLLSRTHYVNDRVAIHYSQDSFHAGVGSQLSWIHKSFVNLLFDNAVPFRFISYEQVAKGELLKNGFPLFIMPHSISLSAEEVKAIEEYVKAGGVLWADALPGTYDEYGRKLEASRLSGMFSSMEEKDIAGVKVKIGNYGEGRIILADIGNYRYARNIGKPETARIILEEALTQATIEPLCRITNRKDGLPAKSIWTAGYASGRQKYIVTGKDYQTIDNTAADVVIDFGGKSHIYEMQSGRYFGYGSSVETTLETARGKVFSLLPYRVKGIRASIQGKPERGQDIVLQVRLNTDGAMREKDCHLLRVSVKGPDGKEAVSLRRLAVIYGGICEIRLPAAYDDTPGQWTICMEDTSTGIMKEVPFRL